jgi:hypothetical protein
MIMFVSMRVGSKVKINHRKAPGTWTINKINRKTVVVEQDGRRGKVINGPVGCRLKY